MENTAENGESTSHRQATNDESSHKLKSIATDTELILSPLIRHGMAVAFVLAFALALVSDLSSGVAAITLIVPDPADTFSKPQESQLLRVSLFGAIKELWQTGSHALSLLIAFTRPYITLILSLCAWLIVPRNLRRRRRLILFADLIGNWSFVDLFVFSIMVVVFRATIPLGGPKLEVWIVPRWGLFGFITASMLSIIGAHVVVYYTRKQERLMREREVATVTNKDGSHQLALQEEAQDNRSLASDDTNNNSRKIKPLSINAKRICILNLLTGIIIYVASAFAIPIFRVYTSRGDIENPPQDYTIWRVGQDLPESGKDDSAGAIRYLQIVYILFGIICPIIRSVLFMIETWLVTVDNAKQHGTLMFAAEIAWTWSSAEVFLLSVIFAVTEIPRFGGGLIEAGCKTCFVVDSELLMPNLIVPIVGEAISIGITLYIMNRRKAYQ